MKWNRREVLAALSAGGLCLALPLDMPKSKPKPKPKWFTHDQLMHICSVMSRLQNNNIIWQEVIDPAASTDCYGRNMESLHEEFYIATIRQRNIMYRRTLDGMSKTWMVTSPTMCKRGVFYPHQFGKFSNPGGKGVWLHKRDWKRSIQEEVTPGVFDVGLICCEWRLYIDTRFHKNVALMGMGHKEVVYYKKGVGLTEWGTPNMVAYMGKPMTKNYALIRMV